MSPEMYVLINLNHFDLNIEPTTATLAYTIKCNLDGAIVPNTQKETSTINAKFFMIKNYFKTRKNIVPILI